MSTSDDLKQLAEAAKAQREAWDAAGQPWPIWNSAMYAMHSALRPEVVLALLEDAERYRWLKVERRPAAELDAAFNTYGIPVDEFIDAARARERQP